MKYRTKLLSLLASCGVTLANANGITIINNSESSKPLEVTFRTAYKDETGSKIQYGQPTTITLKDNYTANIENCQTEQVCGIVIDSIDGHALPEANKAFNQPQTCSMATTTLAPTGSLVLVETMDNEGHGNITCQTKGGITAQGS